MNATPSEVATAVSELLRVGLLRVRRAASAGDATLCGIEADHLHNLPTLLHNYSSELLDFYLTVERDAFLQQLEQHPGTPGYHRDVRQMEPLWAVLRRHVAHRATRAAV